jgi:hypothetical protein
MADLRLQAEADAGAILEDVGCLVTVTDPDETSAEIYALHADIALTIDADTGQFVTGRKASVALQISALAAAGLSVPKGIPDATSKPWIVAVPTVAGGTSTFKITDAHPDATLGLVLCFLESYTPQ